METFVIQIPTQPERTSEDWEELRGVVEHVGSGQRQRFADARQLLAFLRTDHQGPKEEAQR